MNAEEIRAVAKSAEENPDASITDDVTVTYHGGGPARVYSLRLAPEEVAALETAAKRAGVKASALARRWITERLTSESTSNDAVSPRIIAAELAEISRKVATLAA